MGYKSDRTAEDIRREITTIVREMKDPRIDPVKLTVVRTEVAHDLSYCKVYISSLDGINSAKTACDTLNGGAKGHIRKQLGGRIDIRKIPDLKFIPDDSVEKGIEMFRKLESVNKK